jgi:hypothetical protein
MPLATPYPRSYWVVPGQLLAGFYPGDLHRDGAIAKIDALIDCRIRSVVDLTEDNGDGVNGLRPYAQLLYERAAGKREVVTWARMPIVDMGVPSKIAMRLALDFIDRSLHYDRPVYVHCWGGLGRTGVVVGCYMARHHIAVGQAALERIELLRKNEGASYMDSPQTEAQRQMVREWVPGE